MSKIVISIIITLSFLLYIYSNWDDIKIQGFLSGIIYTIIMEVQVAIYVYLKKNSKNPPQVNLTMSKSQISTGIVEDEPENNSPLFYTENEEDSDQEIQNEQNLNNSENEFLQRSLLKEWNSQDIFDDTKTQGIRQKIEQFGEKADFYFKKMKENLTKDEKLPLRKSNKKLVLSKIVCVQTILEAYSNYFLIISKIFEQVGQIGLLQKISNDASQIQQYDENHLHNFQHFISDDKAILIKLPHWNKLKQIIQAQSQINNKQRQYIIKQNFILLSEFQKEYQIKLNEIKKIKKNFQDKYVQGYKEFTLLINDHQNLKNQLHQQTQIYKDMKKRKEEPQKMIKQDMQIKLLQQKELNIEHKVQHQKYALKEIQRDSEPINQQIDIFNETWENQFRTTVCSIIRSFLQNYYDIIFDDLKILNRILNSETPLYESNTYSENKYQEFRNNLDEKDFTILIKNQKDVIVQLMKSYETIQKEFIQIWRYDGETYALIVEFKEAFKKSSNENLIKVKDQMGLFGVDPFNWVLKSLVEDNGFLAFQQIYKQVFEALERVEATFFQYKQEVQSKTKEIEDILKEKVNHIAYIFNCILKDNEALNGQAQQKFSYRDYQLKKDKFEQNFATYLSESQLEIQKINQYFVKCLEVKNKHEQMIAQSKYQILIILFGFLNQQLIVIKENIKIFDLSFQNQYHIERPSPQEINLMKPIRQSSIIVNDRIFQNNPTPPLFEEQRGNMSLFDSQRFKHPQIKMKKSNLEKFMLGQLIKVCFIEWTESQKFKEKLIEEVYISLNDKRPSSLDEIMVTNIELQGSPPKIRNISPLKCTRNQFLFDFDITFRGSFIVEFESKIIINWPWSNYARFPLSVKFGVKSLNGRLRISYKPTNEGKSWFSFVGEPVINIDLEPVLGRQQYNLTNLPSVSDMIREFLIYKLKQMTFPNKEPIRVPLGISEPIITDEYKARIKENIKQWQARQNRIN